MLSASVLGGWVGCKFLWFVSWTIGLDSPDQKGQNHRSPWSHGTQNLVFRNQNSDGREEPVGAKKNV